METLYTLQTRAGTFTIRKLGDGGSRVGLLINDELLGEYDSPEAAAEVVKRYATGHYGWDALVGEIDSPDLDAWTPVAP